MRVRSMGLRVRVDHPPSGVSRSEKAQSLLSIHHITGNSRPSGLVGNLHTC